MYSKRLRTLSCFGIAESVLNHGATETHSHLSSRRDRLRQWPRSHSRKGIPDAHLEAHSAHTCAHRVDSADWRMHSPCRVKNSNSQNSVASRQNKPIHFLIDVRCSLLNKEELAGHANMNALRLGTAVSAGMRFRIFCWGLHARDSSDHVSSRSDCSWNLSLRTSIFWGISSGDALRWNMLGRGPTIQSSVPSLPSSTGDAQAPYPWSSS